GELMPKESVDVTAKIKEPVWRLILRQIYVNQLDRHWRDHLTTMEQLRDGIGLRGYSSKDPKIEYKREGHELFTSMMREVDHNVLGAFCNVRLVSAEEVAKEEARRRQEAERRALLARMQDGHEDEVGDSVAPVAAAAGRPGPAAGARRNGAAPAGRARRAGPALGSRFKKTSKKDKKQSRRR
ncbi:MAG: hypothetical protein AAFU79_23375, partial [Myxococcota bacterium]